MKAMQIYSPNECAPFNRCILGTRNGNILCSATAFGTANILVRRNMYHTFMFHHCRITSFTRCPLIRYQDHHIYLEHHLSLHIHPVPVCVATTCELFRDANSFNLDRFHQAENSLPFAFSVDKCIRSPNTDKQALVLDCTDRIFITFKGMKNFKNMCT